MTDSPGDYEAVDIDIKDIQVKSADTTQGWTSLPNVQTGVYNLMDLTDGTEAVLTSAEYPTGKISQIRLVLGDNNKIVVDGADHDLVTPSAQQSGLKLLVDANLTHGITYSILLDFDAARSIVKTGNGTFMLKPVIKVSKADAADGAIQGVVLPSSENVAVFAINVNDTLASSYVPAGQSSYLLEGLSAGTYTVSFDPGEMSTYAGANFDSVSVTLGQITSMDTVNLQLK